MLDIALVIVGHFDPDLIFAGNAWNLALIVG